MEKEIILASASPRRKALLEQIGLQFSVLVSEAEEKWQGNDPAEIVQSLALAKAEAVAGKWNQEKNGKRGKAEKHETGAVIIGADTVVVQDGKILGKPQDEEDAFKMLMSLRGRAHQVFTGVAVLDIEDGQVRKKILHAEKTEVFVHSMSAEEIRRYVASGEPMDKAGAYGIQGRFAAFIDGIQGDYYNVVGLPVAYVYQVLKQKL